VSPKQDREADTDLGNKPKLLELKNAPPLEQFESYAKIVSDFDIDENRKMVLTNSKQASKKRVLVGKKSKSKSDNLGVCVTSECGQFSSSSANREYFVHQHAVEVLS
jgi:hypothetical protein